MDGGELVFVKVNGRETENVICNVGESASICTGSKQEWSNDNVWKYVVKMLLNHLKRLTVKIG
jgi:hypothetical protein